MSEALHVAYRPQSLDEVVGQDAAVKALKSAFARKKAQTFLMHGPAGCGKTTLARIAANNLGCDKSAILEVDAATNNGIDNVRAIQEMVQYRPFGKNPGRAVILDECHALSANAWQALLKIVEEPPADVYWFLCTTNPARIPQTIKTRAFPVAVSLLDLQCLGEIVDFVCDQEDIDLAKGVRSIVLKEARGSARQALVNLEACISAKDREEASKLLQSALESDAVLELCRFIVKGGSWKAAMAILGRMDKESPEGVRIQVAAYIASILKGCKSDDQAIRLLTILEAFSTPYNPAEQMAPLMRSIGAALYGE